MGLAHRPHALSIGHRLDEVNGRRRRRSRRLRPLGVRVGERIAATVAATMLANNGDRVVPCGTARCPR
jgi:hypothetical protein